MGRCFGFVLGIFVGIAPALSAPSMADRPHAIDSKLSPPTAADQANQRVVLSYGQLPLSFEPNHGQSDPAVRFLARGPGFRVGLASDAVITTLAASTRDANVHRSEVGADQASFRVRILGANTSAVANGEAELPGKANYLIGNDPSRHITDISTFARVRFAQVYPGIDVVYYGNNQQIEYDFVVEAGADPRKVRLAFDGVSNLRIEEQGHLAFETAVGTSRQLRPVVYQIIDGERREIRANYVVGSSNEVAFEINEYDVTQSLVIDPILSYSTYLGGQGRDAALSIAVDAGGNAYVTGTTTSTDFPLVNEYDRSVGSNDNDVFVSKLNSAGTALVYSTYLGGRNGLDRAFSIAVDGSGSAYIMGETSDADYPTTTGAYQSGVSGGASFVTKLGGAGNTLVYSTYLRDANAYALAVDGNGNAYVTGIALSGFVTTTGVIQVASPYPSGSSPFVIKLNPAGSAPVYSTFLGGSGAGSSSYVPDVAVALAVDSVGNAYIAGRADSTDFPTVNAFAATQAVGYDAFISKINPSGTALSYSTYLGGSRGDYALAVAVDTAGSAYVTGFTASADFPIKNAFQVSNPGNTTQGSSIVAFVTKLSPRGTDLAYSSYLGGGCGTPGGSYCLIDSPDRGNAITVDSQGHAFVAGSITSNRFPLVDSIEPGSSDLASGWFVAQVSRSGSSLLYSTLLGGSSESASQRLTSTSDRPMLVPQAMRLTVLH